MDLINYVYLLFVICYIVDVSGVINDFKVWIFKRINGKNIEYIPISWKPFDCSKCLVFWIFLIIEYIYSQNILYTLLIASMGSYLSFFVTMTLKLISELYQDLIDRIVK